jgi:2-keto-3-deoxy-L-fuconate dehydrogenase
VPDQTRVAIVTGGANGIGRATCREFSAAGLSVVVVDVDTNAARDTCEAVRAAGAAAIWVEADVSRSADVQRYVEAALHAYGRIDVLFNCAGYVHNGSILQATDDDWNFAFNLNARSQFWMIQAVLPGMLASGSGSIINMASVCGSVKGLPNRFIYGASKAAVVGLTKAVAADFVGKGIRCNAIAPGTVDTPSLGDRINSYTDPVQARKDFIARQPMGRLAQAEEIAPIIVYLASDESVFASGQVFAVDGGITI